jgi:hypothetical protein
MAKQTNNRTWRGRRKGKKEEKNREMESNLQGKPFEDTIDHCNNLMTQKSPRKPFHSSKGFKTIAQCFSMYDRASML